LFTDIKAVIFDMDGIIVDTEPLSQEVDELIFKKEFNITIGDVYFETVGIKEEEAIEFYIKHFGLDINADELVSKKRAIYGELLKEKASPIQGSVELINSIKRRYRLALASSATVEYVRTVLKKLTIEDAFEVIVTGDDVKNGKPDPEIYLLAATKLGVDPSECLVLEDAEKGVKAAKEAGMKCIAVPTEFTKNLDFSRADLVIGNMTKVQQYLTKN
jgi:HAD superfamily hydrolase (TIGR01509 family)